MKFLFSVTLALALLVSAPALGEGKIDVLSQNQYLGGNLDPIVSGEVEFNQAVIDALSEIAANDIATRAELLASLIAGRLPEVAGLQEVFRFECYDILWPAPTDEMGCDDPRIADAFPEEGPVPGSYVNDHLTLTLQALDALEEKYQAKATVNNLDLTQPVQEGLPPGIPVYLYGGSAENGDIPDITVTVLDRDVILVRDDLANDATALGDMVDLNDFCPGRVSEDGCNYGVVASAPSPIGPINIQRGWVALDLTIDGTVYRIVDTHLEVQNLLGPPPQPGVIPFGSVQAAQATELAVVLAGSLQAIPTDQLIVVGDINSGPTDGIFGDPFFPDPNSPVFPPEIPLYPPYLQLTTGVDLEGQPTPLGALTDTWTVTGNIPGFSCCQLSDLSNISSIHDERIDVIFSLEEPRKGKKKRVLGSKVADKSGPQGLWPSDHGTVAVELQFE